jgi:arginase family enzyme
MKTSTICFPFDLFGSAGTAVGVHLIADALRELLADNKRESIPTRAACYTKHVRLRELTFETLEDYNSWRQQGRKAARAALRQDDFLLWVTGNHLGALPVFDELSPLGEDVLVIQLDAHLDVHQFRDCTTELSHGNFLLHCEGPLPPIINVGHRDLLLPPDAVSRSFRAAYSAADLITQPNNVRDAIHQAAGRARRVFLDLDCDAFDPAFFPAVSTPVPFGLSPAQVLSILDAAWTPNFGGLILSEFEPARDREDRSLATLMWLVEYVLLRRYETTAEPR